MKSKILEPLPTDIPPHETPVDFAENFKWEKLITFRAESFQKWVYSVIPMAASMDKTENFKDGTKVGKKYFYLRPFETWSYQRLWMFPSQKRLYRNSLVIYKGYTKGAIGFDDIVYIPILGDGIGQTWMSLTPNEILSLRGAVRRAKGNVGMAGLGLGWAALRVLERQKVKSLTIVEKDNDVLQFFGKPLKKRFGKKLALVNDDAYEYDWTKHDVSLWDIWQGQDDAAYDNRFIKIRDNIKKLGKVCVGWGIGSNV